MNEADRAIGEVREIRHRISVECGHDIDRYLVHLREVEKDFPEQVRRGQELMRRRMVEREEKARQDEQLILREKPER